MADDKKKHRGRGEGSIFYNEKFDRWEAWVSYNDPKTDVLRRKRFTGAKESEARAKMREWQKAVDDGMLPGADRLTLWDWLDRWLKDYVQSHVKPKTYEKYESQLRCYVKPSTIGKQLLSKLRGPDIQRFYGTIAKTGGKDNKSLSSFTVRSVHACLHAAFKQAVTDGLIPRNIIEGTKPPRLAKLEIHPLDAAQVKNLLETARAFGEFYYAIILVALETGMRKGEIFGLKWADIDSKKNAILVRRQLVTASGSTILQETKTKTSRRRIPVPKEIVSALEHYRKVWQAPQKLRLGKSYDDQDMVFATEIGTPYHPNTFHKTYREILKKVNLDDRDFHCLRHTHACMLLNNGWNPKAVQERLGHSSIRVTMDVYGHLFPDIQEQLVLQHGMLTGNPVNKGVTG